MHFSSSKPDLGAPPEIRFLRFVAPDGEFWAIVESIMIGTFDRDGVRFQYPQNWTLEEDEMLTEDGEPIDADDDDAEAFVPWTITLNPPGTGFLLVALRPDCETPQMLAHDTLEALKEEYPTLEAEESVTSLAGQPAIGYDIDFITLDSVVTTQVRALQSPLGPVLFLGQFVEAEKATFAPVLAAILASLQIDSE